MQIKDILAGKDRAVYSVQPTATVADVVDELGRRSVGAVLVLAPDGRLRGIVSERDIVRHLGLRGTRLLQSPVTGVMTQAVRTCAPTDDVARAMRVMTVGRHRHLPVLEGDVVVGMVSIGDLVKHRVAQMELETAVLRDVVIARS